MRAQPARSQYSTLESDRWGQANKDRGNAHTVASKRSAQPEPQTGALQDNQSSTHSELHSFPFPSRHSSASRHFCFLPVFFWKVSHFRVIFSSLRSRKVLAYLLLVARQVSDDEQRPEVYVFVARHTRDRDKRCRRDDTTDLSDAPEHPRRALGL